MRLGIFLVIVFFSHAVAGQQDRTRTRLVDYAAYDQLTTNLAYAANKLEAANRLMKFVDENFTAVDEEYFNARILVVAFVESLGETGRASELIREAIGAYELHYPFVNRGYSMLTPESIEQAYLTVSRLNRTQRLFEKNLRYLESKQALLESSEHYYSRLMYYSELSNTLIGLERYDEAIISGLKLRDLTESGVLKMKLQSADEVFKIDPSLPEETKQQLLKAKAEYEKSMQTSNEVVLNSNRQTYNALLSSAYFNSFQYAEALPYAKAVWEHTQRMNAMSRESLANSEQYMNSPYLADSVKQQMIDSRKYLSQVNTLGGTATALIIAACKSGQTELARPYATGLIDQAIFAQLTGNFSEAERYYTEAFKLITSLAGYKFVGASAEAWRQAYLPVYLNLQVQKSNLTYAYEESTKLLLSEEELLKKNFQFFSEAEKKEFFKGYSKKLDEYYSLLLLMTERGDDRVGEILNKVIQTKGLILDATREQERQLRRLNDRVALAQLKEIRRLRDKLAAFYQVNQKSPSPAINDSINRLSVRVADLEQALNRKLGASELLKPVPWQQVQSKLKKGEVYLEIVRVQRTHFTFDKPKVQYWAFVIKPGESKPGFFQIGEGDAFEIRSFRNYQNRVRTQVEDTDSYNTYWLKISEQLKGVHTAILSADGVYHILNPVTLQNPATQKFVLDEIEVKRVSTGRDLLTTTPEIETGKSIVLVGNPQFDMSRKQGNNRYRSNEIVPVETSETTRAGISALPGTKKEVELIRIKAAESGFKTELLTALEANESNVKKLKNPAVLHLATHGQFDQLSKADTYLKSKLILAGAADREPLSVSDYELYEDGFLTAYEVTQLDLPETRLVVLSACETGLGEIQSGEGVWGLQRAFQLAGARSVMGSLWKISDEATVTFMEAFYKNYLTTANISEAYQQAMQTTRVVYPQPYYWGAFILIGAN
ncbi:MAG: CHAT domain-containing protein [Bacteroidetes bacterium CHB5]|nr:CHAT domain-containing protein [Bacteroidetes bacterium CHB5]